MWRPCVAKTLDICKARDKVSLLLQGLWVILVWTLCHKGLRPCAPGHFGFLHKKDSICRILCDLTLCFRTETIMWLAVLQFRFRTCKILCIEFPQFRFLTIPRLKVPQFHFRIQNIVWLEALKLRNSASAQGKYCGLECTQFHFYTINLVRLEVSQFRFHTWDLTLSPAVPPPHKEYSVTLSSTVSFLHKEYTMSRSSAVLLSHTEQSVTWSSAVSHNIPWFEVSQFRNRKKRRHLKLRSSASPREHYFSLENQLQFLIIAYLFTSHSTTHQFSCCLTWMTDTQ